MKGNSTRIAKFASSFYDSEPGLLMIKLDYDAFSCPVYIKKTDVCEANSNKVIKVSVAQGQKIRSKLGEYTNFGYITGNYSKAESRNQIVAF